MTLCVILLAVLVLVSHLPTKVSAASFGCKNSLISDEWRQKVLSIHNDNRSKLAKGEQEGSVAGAKLPIAINMNKLTWDCNIEELAEAKAINCPDNPIAPPPADGEAYGITSQKIAVAGSCESINLTATAMQEWWNEGAKRQVNEKVVGGNKIFSQMAYSKVNAFACTYQTCPADYYLLCVYNKLVGDPDTNLYAKVTDAPKNTVCSDCGAVGGVNILCANGLCLPPFSPAKLPTTVCLPDPCTTPMTDDFRNAALNMHNYYRRTLATGWAKDGTEGTEYALRAKAMIELKYDKVSEDAAWAHVNTCPDAAGGAAEGENFFKSDNLQSLPQAALQEAIEKWWSPLSTIGLGADTTYTAALQGNDMKRFANMAYDKSTKIGCAAKKCVAQGYTAVDCRYNPVIAVGTKIYETGAPCQCTPPSTCTQLGGLCSNS